MNFKGLATPNYSQMGTEVLPSGNRGAMPYGQAEPTSQAPMVSTASMQGSGTDSAASGIGYRPMAGRADRLAANIVGGTDFDNLGSGGYSKGATSRM